MLWYFLEWSITPKDYFSWEPEKKNVKILKISCARRHFVKFVGYFPLKISFYYTVDCKPRIAVSLVIKIRAGTSEKFRSPGRVKGLGTSLWKAVMLVGKLELNQNGPDSVSIET